MSNGQRSPGAAETPVSDADKPVAGGDAVQRRVRFLLVPLFLGIVTVLIHFVSYRTEDKPVFAKIGLIEKAKPRAMVLYWGRGEAVYWDSVGLGARSGNFPSYGCSKVPFGIFEGISHTLPLLIGKVGIRDGSNKQEKTYRQRITPICPIPPYRCYPTPQSKTIGAILLVLGSFLALGCLLSRSLIWLFVAGGLAVLLIHLGLDEIFFGDAYVSLWLSKLYEI
jgi:hypothetical protein